MKLKLLAVLAFAAYHYDRQQLIQGKPSIFAGIRNFLKNNIGFGDQASLEKPHTPRQ